MKNGSIKNGKVELFEIVSQNEYFSITIDFIIYTI